MSDSVQPHRWKPTRLPHPWDSPGKNTRVACHFLLQGMMVKSENEVTQSCPILSNPMDWLLCPWDFPGMSTGVGCHCLLQKMPLVLIKIDIPRAESTVANPTEWHHHPLITQARDAGVTSYFSFPSPLYFGDKVYSSSSGPLTQSFLCKPLSLPWLGPSS